MRVLLFSSRLTSHGGGLSPQFHMFARMLGHRSVLAGVVAGEIICALAAWPRWDGLLKQVRSA
jgi:hypothetical protein